MGRLQTGSNLKGWLFYDPKEYLVNQLRKWRNSPPMIEIEVGDGVSGSIVEPSKNSHDLYVSKMETEQVRAAIQELAIPFREIIPLREYGELSRQEIAGILDCPVGKVMSRLGRARAKLRELPSATLERSDSPSVRGSR